MKCYFNDCPEDATPNSWKCTFHRHRRACQVDECRNQVYARRLCVRHGGKRQCQVPFCGTNIRVGTFCTKHGGEANKRYCKIEGCNKQAHLQGKCVRHGGGRLCKTEGCTAHARHGSFCKRHQDPNRVTKIKDENQLAMLVLADSEMLKFDDFQIECDEAHWTDALHTFDVETIWPQLEPLPLLNLDDLAK
ncbi:unnamed protein product [Aphanomyces euteiches]|uniref:WRKY19-like zinc finger domain-containing protein n=1 Tax=Aphanomyces euteiches TaxID=100861 RepID=A0A6G0XE28_9STRA|nr:hypothetical protein Ae201684_005666 [Aphanomyces euteiches]KAH9078310.1 hypothetical protein Ae201684P_019401 [Aphanomyces euteiches]KAH9143291.1 hypothetical protein AeRB84_012693 [Aphanomyces euteiches]